MAISYDKNGHEIGRDELSTAKDDTQLTIKPEKDSVQKGHLSYVRLSLTDSNGVWKPMEKDRIKVSVSGGELVALGNGCPYNPDGYLKDETFTYYGEMLAIVRAGDTDKVTITATGSDGKEYTCEIPVIA